MSTLQEGKWLRCRDLKIEGERLYYMLLWDRPYDLVQSYPKDPHLQFLRAETSTDIVSFVRSWGPVRMPNGATPAAPSCSEPLTQFTKPQRQLRVVVNMLNA